MTAAPAPTNAPPDTVATANPHALESLAPFDAAECDQLRARFDAIQGFLHPEEGYALFRLTRLKPVPGAVVEIGSFMGRSTCWLAQAAALINDNPVHAVDHFRGSDEHQPGKSHQVAEIVSEGSTFRRFQQNLEGAGLLAHVAPMQMSSVNAAAKWSGPIRLCFIDGDHSYGGTLTDFSAWRKFVVPGGHIAFHDFGAWPGVTRAYGFLLGRHRELTEVAAVKSLRIVRVGA